MLKEVTLKYAEELEAFVRELRKEIIPDENADTSNVLDMVEEAFFESNFSKRVEYKEIVSVIAAIYSRVKSKYGILQEYLLDSEVNEIMVNGPNEIFVERNRHVVEVDNAFLSVEELEGIIRMLASDVHREINEANPIVDARMKNGYRINGILQNVALNGPALTIRKFAERMITMDDLVERGSMTIECKEDLCALTECGYNIFISGGTSSGKTTLLNALAEYIHSEERVVIIEDSAELNLNHLKNRVQLECRSANSIGKGEVTMDQLIRTSLRMRPDRIIVGEVRGGEVLDMIQAMNTGHSGSISTGHGNSIQGMLNRLETMYMMSANVPVYSVRNQIANAIEIFIHLQRDGKGMRKVVEVAEIDGFDGEEYRVNYLYQTNSMNELIRTGNSLIHRGMLRRGGCDDRL